MVRLCREFVDRLPELRHIQMDRVAIVFAQARKRELTGMQASLTPLRFEGGSRVGVRRGRRFTMRRLCDAQGRELLYLLTFYLPRYLDLDFRAKLETAVHELWHISPACDGDLRRHAGRCYAHSASQAAYDANVARLVDRWLRQDPPIESYGFLRLSFDELRRRHGQVVGLKIPRPKLIPLA
jgi:predicted metallopeptidase